MGRVAYDRAGSTIDSYGGIVKRVFAPKTIRKAKLDTRIEQERSRRNHWFHKFGFEGEKASGTERAAEEQRKNDFCNSLGVDPEQRHFWPPSGPPPKPPPKPR